MSAEDVPGATEQLNVDGEPISMADLVAQTARDPSLRRIETGWRGLDWLLGGGLPVGIAYLLMSPPGGGKTTLLIMLLRALACLKVGCLYVQTEETQKQLGVRFARLGVFPKTHFRVVQERNLDSIIQLFERERPRIAAVDSLHRLEGVTDSNDFQCSTGSPSAVEIGASTLRDYATSVNMTLIAVAHSTKGGDVAGCNSLIHDMDATLFLDGKLVSIGGRQVIRGKDRLLSSKGKNRYANEDRRVHLEMRDDGIFDMGVWTEERPPWEPQAPPNIVIAR